MKPFNQRRFFLKTTASASQLGPFGHAELVDLARNGNITSGSLIAEEEKPESWLSIADTPIVYDLPAKGEDPRLAVEQKPKKKLSQRTIDYILICGLGNCAIFGLSVLVTINPMSLMFILALAVIFNVALFWVMFAILAPY